MTKTFRIAAAAVLLTIVAACGDRLSTAERLTLANDTIATTARVTQTALTQGRVTVTDACRIDVYGRLAGAAIDAGFDAYVRGDGSGAAAHLQAAQNILSGVSQEAVAQVERECN